jgi:hypothetical protein
MVIMGKEGRAYIGDIPACCALPITAYSSELLT